MGGKGTRKEDRKVKNGDDARQGKSGKREETEMGGGGGEGTTYIHYDITQD